MAAVPALEKSNGFMILHMGEIEIFGLVHKHLASTTLSCIMPLTQIAILNIVGKKSRVVRSTTAAWRHHILTTLHGVSTKCK